MRIALGTDHRGYALKEHLARYLREEGHEVLDMGTGGEEPADYPLYAFSVGEKVAAGVADRGILICGTGIGMSIAANKVSGVRAALVYDEEAVRLSREHNDANVLVLPGNWLSDKKAIAWVDQWLAAAFEGERHLRRVGLIDDYDRSRENG
ncbi:ribose 5-phosphate isomerase B [bacterium]|nr:ribose 5-phosphate isomerase B [bacterium]